MTAPPPVYLGIDLGTTNSTAAVFDGTRVDSVRTSQGGTLTPSVVRIDARGNVTTGARARKFLDSDPKNTRAEFKRLMGTAHTLDFAAARAAKRPEELSAEILKAIRADAHDQLGFTPETAVISVPALFEVAQTAATSEAARLAGFSRVEMIQEPVASAIAAGWSAEQGDESWLVYDFGGGTFDATLLSTKEGMLRVVGHDGDNFLGGRDFDAKIVDWVLADAEKNRGLRIDRADPAHAAPLRKLRHAAEEAKIELARANEAALSLPELFTLGGETFDIDVMVSRGVLDEIALPLVDRSIAVCRRLLAAHGAPRLGRVVLVGGPTAMPVLRARVGEALGAPFRDGLDPMTLVAQGAALYAATAQLDARPKPKEAAAQGPRVWLQYPAMTPDLSPFVVGKVLDTKESKVVAVVVHRVDGEWSSAVEPLDAEGAFAIQVSLAPRKPSAFRIEGVLADGAGLALAPPTFSMVHGVTIQDPPLSRSIGVALANDRVQVYFERGSPLPMRRTFTLHTVETVSHGVDGFALRVPVVQGEFSVAHLCRLVGALEIPSKDVKATLPAGSAVEVTLELDRGGRLSATARVPPHDQVFDQVAHLVAPSVPVEELAVQMDALRARAATVRALAFQRGLGATAITKLGDVDAAFQDLASEIDRARGGDADAAEKSRRMLLELDATIADVDAALAWPALEDRIRERVAWATSWLAEYGTPDERKVLAETSAAIEKARIAKDPVEVERQLTIINRLGFAAYARDPQAWDDMFERAASRIDSSPNLKRATELVRDGRRALASRDRKALEGVVRELWTVLPADTEERQRGYSSGVR
jgi:molecular chaperone DnaK